MKILLVEDSKFLRLAMARALARAGYDISLAADGDEALLMANEKQPDLILLDMMLPKMSGLGVLKALKKEPATEAIPVVVLTALSQANSERLRSDGAVGFLAKTELSLDQGEEALLDAVRKIVTELPGASRARAACGPNG
jgi:CheY-like chemotaxis protein